MLSEESDCDQYWSAIEPVLVTARSSTGQMSDQYWSQSPLNTGSAEAAARVYTICMGDERIRISALAEGTLPFLIS